MIGSVVAWNRFDADGKPTMDLTGTVVAVSSDHALFRLLVKTAGGIIRQVEALDVRVVGGDEIVVLLKKRYEGLMADSEMLSEVANGGYAECPHTCLDLQGQIDLVGVGITESGFADAIPAILGTVGARAHYLLKTLGDDLRELGALHEADEEKISALIRERDVFKAERDEAWRLAENTPAKKKGKPQT